MKTEKIAIQGTRGCFHEEAANVYSNDAAQMVGCSSFEGVRNAVISGQADAGVMAIENTLAGTLLPNYHLIRESDLHIVGEIYLRIAMNLMVIEGVQRNDIKYVRSHPIALRQCAKFLAGMPHTIAIDDTDTAGAAADLAASGRTDTAVIAGKQCAAIYGLDILAQNIETHHRNFTRFFVLKRKKNSIPETGKASISFQLPHEPGSLGKALQIFTDHALNLTKIQSLPIIGKPYEYHFHTDLLWKNKGQFKQAMRMLSDYALEMRVLGTYVPGNMNEVNQFTNS